MAGFFRWVHDHYAFMQPELVALLEKKVGPFLK